ncbi:hypothetical protein OOZ15_18750 [Galbibacter sp. EGI 63066]|uniref:hypothetical protein n=1 Tax=Galbibacter sp. EGI 63066 TaxID=2993559 RepID=UPI0022488CB9|nr:hypothetical protein [Galbibacter sp. EGI 63066]MCX2681998.1 hypothetical protein [Galbibacter sp. EGI 63066]
MKRLLPCICFFSALLSYPSTRGYLTLFHSDTLSLHAKKQPVVPEKKVSPSFLDKLASKFPEPVENSINRKISSPEFNWQYIKDTYKIPDTVATQQGIAAESFNEIEESGLWVKRFGNEDIVTLPVGVKDSVGNVEYAIGVVKAEINPKYTKLTVFARVRIPQSNEKGEPLELFFGADDVKLSHQGGIIGDAKLVLLGDVPIPFNGGNWLVTFNGGMDMGTGATMDLTYATIDCDGIKNLSLDGSVEFSRKYILPLTLNGEVDEASGERVRADFNVTVEDWNDLLVGVSVQPFTRAQKRNGKDYDGNFQFYLNEAVLDFSDLRNSPNVHFPEYYVEKGLLMPNPNTWRGIYIETIDVRLPKEYKTKGAIERKERIGFGAHHMIFDSYGLSGTFYADNLFQMDEGRTNEKGAWAYSLDHIEVSLAANQFIGAGFNGRILMPVSKETNESGKIGLRYAGLITEEEYMLHVATDSVVDFNLWQAKGQLLPNSSIELRVVESKFRPRAILNGRLAINASQKKSLETEGEYEENDSTAIVQFKGIEFQQMVLQTESPVFAVGYLGYNDEVKFGNFPVSIANIELTTQANYASLWFDLNINLMDGAGFGGSTRLGIQALNEERDYRQRWKYDGLDVQEIFISADMSAFSFEGRLTIMDDDPEYGDGFAGQLTAKFQSLGNVEIGASGIFGRVDGYRYWYFDASVNNLVPPGTPGLIVPSGFAGGAYYKMKRKGFSSAFSTAYYSDQEAQESGLSGKNRLAYAPDKNMGLGVKAMIMFYVGANGVVNGGAGFEVLFNNHGGISRMGFYGQAKIMAELPMGDDINNLMDKVKESAPALDDFMNVDDDSSLAKVGKPFLKKADMSFPDISTKMGVEAYVGIEYDFENSTLHGEFDLYVNVAGGVVAGRASKGRAGWAVYHFAPGEWYIHMGTPTDRLGLKIGVGPVSIQTGGYFMMGDKIPGSPPPPPIVAEILREDVQTLDYMRDLNALGEGRGFAFGADFSVDTGDINFLMVYARFQAGAGFDIMLKDYGEAACKNRGGDQIGIDGWYANGQSYAYLQGELGINIKLFFVRKKIPIIKGAAAVLLQAKAPNPVWLRGYVAGEFELLGGLIKGNFRLKLTIGEECELMDASPLGGMKIIADVTPKDGSKDIDVFAAPQATFSMKVNEPIVIPEDDGDKTYKIIVEKFRIVHEGKEIPGRIKWGTNGDRGTYISSDILPPHEPMKVEVEVSFKEYVNGKYQTIMVDGQKAVETEVRNFTTGEAPDHIPLHNIVYSYPVIDQKHFLKNEYDKGYIQLERGQDYLFDLADWKTDIRVIDQTGKQSTTAFNYDTGDNKVFYNTPDLSNNTQYKMLIVSTTKKESTSNNETTYKNQDAGDGNTTQIRQNQAENVIQDGEIERLAYDFKTSRYNTFKQKIRNINTVSRNWGKIYSDVIFLANQIQSDETFDVPELTGNDYTENKPLVSVTATLSDDYYQKDMNPPLYSHYPFGGKYTVKNREENEYGMPPKKAVPILAHYLTSAEYETNLAWMRNNFPYFYNLPLIYKKDWVDLHSQIINDYVDGKITRSHPAYSFLDKDYYFMRYGKYTVNMQYMLPGGIRGTSIQYDFKNNNRFR